MNKEIFENVREKGRRKGRGEGERKVLSENEKVGDKKSKINKYKKKCNFILSFSFAYYAVPTGYSLIVPTCNTLPVKSFHLLSLIILIGSENWGLRRKPARDLTLIRHGELNTKLYLKKMAFQE